MSNTTATPEPPYLENEQKRRSDRVWRYLVEFDADPHTSSPSIPRILLLVYATLTVGVVGLSVVAQLNPTRLGALDWNALFIAEPGDVNIPIYVYMYAFFGTCAYIFANVIRDDTMTLLPREVLYRVFAVLPVSAGVYLLQEIIWPGTVFSVATLAGIAFLTGFSIEAALKLLSVFVDRLLKAIPGELHIAPKAAPPTESSTSDVKKVRFPRNDEQ